MDGQAAGEPRKARASCLSVFLPFHRKSFQIVLKMLYCGGYFAETQNFFCFVGKN